MRKQGFNSAIKKKDPTPKFNFAEMVYKVRLCRI